MREPELGLREIPRARHAIVRAECRGRLGTGDPVESRLHRRTAGALAAPRIEEPLRGRLVRAPARFVVPPPVSPVLDPPDAAALLEAAVSVSPGSLGHQFSSPVIGSY